MRILYLLRNAEGGIRVHVEALMRGALNASHEALLITDLEQADRCFTQTLATDAELRKRVVSIPMRSMPGPWDLMTLWLLMVGLRSARDASMQGFAFDVIHGHGAKGGLFARLLRLLRIVPRSTAIVYTPHGGSLHDMHGRIMNWLYPKIERWLARSTDLLLFESRYSQEQYRKKIGDIGVPMRLNQNGVAITEPDLAAWPEGLGRTEPLKICAFGLLRPIKGFAHLIKAVRILIDTGYNVELDIFGEGQERAALKRLIEDLDFKGCVRLCGETTDVRFEMQLRHVVVQPSLFESFGLVALEGQMLGRAVIASRVGGLKDVVDDQKTGILVEPESPQALADAIAYCIDHPLEVQTLRARATRWARDVFSQDRMIQGALDAYSSAKP